MAQILTPRSRRTRNSTWSRTVSACMDPRASSGMHTHGGHVYRSIVHGGAGGASCKTLCGPRQPTPCYRVMDRRYYFVLKRTIWARTCSTAVPLGRRGRAHHAVSNHPRPPFFLLTRHLAGVRSQQHASSRSCSSEALILLASPPLAAVEPVANKCLLLIPQRWN